MERDEKVEVKVETQVEIIPVVEEMEMGCVPTMLMSQLTCVLTMSQQFPNSLVSQQCVQLTRDSWLNLAQKDDTKENSGWNRIKVT